MKFIFPTPIFYVNKIGKYDITHGSSHGFWICIVKKYKDDKGLLEHELTHVKQFWIHGLLIHKLLYTFWKYYRFDCELNAYVRQWKVSNGDEDLRGLFVMRIFLCYKLKFSREYILKKFEEKC
jgi:hypothetical protein